MAQRSKVNLQRLTLLEEEFTPALIKCLEECARGRWGLFGQNLSPEAERYLNWHEARNLKIMAHEIQSLRLEFGQPHILSDRFLYYCSLKGSNVPGEPKLAQAFLDEITVRPK